MSKKITKLTKEQEAKFPEWVNKWTKIGLSTEKADFEATEKAVRACYDLAGLKQPKIVLRIDSPVAGCCAGVMGLKVLEKLLDLSMSQVGSQVGSQVVDSYYYNLSRGQFLASWGAYISFFRDCVGFKDDCLKKFELDEIITKNCGYVWWHEDVAVIINRPKEIHLDGSGRLHSTTGPSISYRDGWSLYHVHGVAVPEEWITKPKTLKPEMALTWKNIEQRRAAAEILGWEKVLFLLPTKIINQDPDPEIGTLLEVDIPEAGIARFLQVQCGTGRRFSLSVPREMKTALEANAWTFDIKDKQLSTLEVRT